MKTMHQILTEQRCERTYDEINTFVNECRKKIGKVVAEACRGRLNTLESGGKFIEGRLQYAERLAFERTGQMEVFFTAEETVATPKGTVFTCNRTGYLRAPYSCPEGEEPAFALRVWKFARDAQALQGLPWTQSGSFYVPVCKEGPFKLQTDEFRYALSFGGKDTLFNGEEKVHHSSDAEHKSALYAYLIGAFPDHPW